MENKFENFKGLTSREVEERLKDGGYNELPSQKPRRFWMVLAGVLREPMLLLLVVAGTIYFFLGESSDALMLSVFVVFIVGITFYQERKTERAMAALRDLSSPRALVVRDGVPRRIAGREVVAGDILVLREGDRVPADGAVLNTTNLMVDESLLTGEALAVSKAVWDEKQSIANEPPAFGEARPTQVGWPGGDNLPFVYSGTLITRGHGLARVTAIGGDTRMGAIGKSLQTIKEGDTLLKKETGRLAGIFGVVGLALCIAAAVLYYLLKGDPIEGILYGLTIGMSMLPEEFPVVTMVFLALGAWRISKRKVLTRNTAAVEALGAATVLCVDKTGTLTLNQMRLREMAVAGRQIKLSDYEGEGKENLPEEFRCLLEYSMLASQSDPYDPLEKEIKKIGNFYLFSTNRLHTSWKMIKEYPFDGNLLALSHVWESEDGDRYAVAAKGAPESIADLCHLSASETAALEFQIKPMLERGLRLIAVAQALASKPQIAGASQREFDFKFVGLLGFRDPIRPSVPAAIKECYAAGIRVCMITGDYPGTAQFIAREAGIVNSGEYLTGADLRKLNNDELRKRIKTVNIFARVVPEQKMFIVNAFRESGEVIAMTGDGVNDAPALKAANIGIAMGERGTDVARETADLVLLDDNFTSIVGAVRMGRMVFDNIKKAISYIFAVHIPIAGISFLPVALGMPVVFFPAHIAFLELVIDPACSVAFEAEPENKNVMNRPPRKLSERLFDKKTAWGSLLRGLGVLAAVFAVFAFEIKTGQTEGAARAATFAAIVFANLGLIMTSMSQGNFRKLFTNGNKPFRYIFFSALAMLALVLYVPALRQVFHFDPIGAADLALAFLAAALGAFWLQPFKRLFKKQNQF
jgi:Ca2+-transporting ATPase